jgi:tetratricopeptide (TPR) repeat protein
MGRRTLIACLLTALLAAAAAGDTVYLKDGRKLVGKVTKVGDKLRVEMRYGTAVVEASEVSYIAPGKTSTRPAGDPAEPTTRRGRPRPEDRSEVVWDRSEARRPEPIVFMILRRIELLGADPAAETFRKQLKHQRIAVHDGLRKVGTQWIDRDEQRRRRREYEKRIQEAKDLAGKVRSLAWSKKPEDIRKRKQLAAEAVRAMERAAAVWPDEIMQTFLRGVLELEQGDYRRAERSFARCIELQPMVAAYHQGRGLALLGLDRPRESLAEFIAVVQLRDDEWESVERLVNAMKEVPGREMQTPAYKAAQRELDRFAETERKYKGYSQGVSWLMPGRRPWRARNEVLFTPEYDRLTCRQALGVPVAEHGLLADPEALAGAEQIYVEVNGKLLPAKAKPAPTSIRRGGKDLPVAGVLVSGATFTPVQFEQPADLTAGRRVEVRGVNLYRRMGTGIRKGHAEVIAGDDGKPHLDRGLPAGEALGAVFADGKFARLLTGRTDAEADPLPPSELIDPEALAEHLKRLQRSMAYGGGYRSGPKLKDDAATVQAEGSVFLIHVLAAESVPEEQTP